jgi:hypothetical protein
MNNNTVYNQAIDVRACITSDVRAMPATPSQINEKFEEIILSFLKDLPLDNKLLSIYRTSKLLGRNCSIDTLIEVLENSFKLNAQQKDKVVIGSIFDIMKSAIKCLEANSLSIANVQLVTILLGLSSSIIDNIDNQ